MPRKKKTVKQLTRDQFISRYVWPRARAALRFWPPAIYAMEQVKMHGNYLCVACKRFRPKMHRDHKVPIGKKEGRTWDELFQKLFCEADNFQILCIDCHKAKTKKERSTLSA